MRRLITYLTLIFGLSLGLAGCSDDPDGAQGVPQVINTFIQRYWPGAKIESFTDLSEGYRASIKDGASLTFAKDYQWESINGNGGKLPAVLLFDQVPPALFQYLQEMQSADDVFVLTRTSADYTAILQALTVTYNIKTAQITEKGL